LRRSDSGRHGFTLIEVLLAVMIVSLVFGLLLEAVTRNLADLHRAREGARAAQLAADRVRDLKEQILGGQKVEDGVTEGTFEQPDDDLRWQISIAAQTLPLPPDYKGELSPSPIFAAPNEPTVAQNPGEDPPLRLVQVRVYAQNEDPQSVDPFVILLTAPASGAPNAQQPGTNPNGTPGQPGNNPNQPQQPQSGGMR